MDALVNGRRRNSFALVLCLLLILWSMPALSQTYINAGKVSGVWTPANSPYIVQGAIAVEENQTLVLRPGVVVKFEGYRLLVDEGEGLTAIGTPDSMIVFTSNKPNPAPGDWGDFNGGIVLSGIGDKAALKYCVVEYATNGVACMAYAYGCDGERNSAVIENCVIRYNKNSGIFAEGEGSQTTGCIPAKSGNSSPKVKFNLIYENGGDGIELRAYDGYQANGYIGAEIFRNVIAGNARHGIQCYGDDPVQPQLRHNTIVKNGESGILFRKNFDARYFVIANNIIAQNRTGINSADSALPAYGYNDVWNNTVNYQNLAAATGDISYDPLFVNAANRDFHLQPSSPCIDAGDPLSAKDPDSTRADIGAFYFHQIFPPKALFTAAPVTGLVPLTVQFTNQSTGEINAYSWSFGDGQTSAVKSPSHIYQSAGKYTVKLTVAGPGGSDSLAKAEFITVNNPPPPIPRFSASPTAGLAPLNVQFTNQSTGNITSQLWNFGDGQTSAEQNPSHLYALIGNYTVSLSVTGLGGTVAETKTNYISVTATGPYFVDGGFDLTPMRSGVAAWGDYEGDGDLDILMTGLRDNTFYALIYTNNGNGSFTKLNAALAPVAYGNAAWGDYDHDGDLDVLLAGWDNTKDLLYVYKNAGNGSFVKLSQSFKAVGYMDADWGDVDNDGDLDFVVSGLDNNTTPIVYLYVNNRNDSFSYSPLSLATPVYDGSVTLGDYDNDGDLDLLLTGRKEANAYTLLYRNDGNARFTNSNAVLQGVYSNSLSKFGDYDNDGDLDVILMGNDMSGLRHTAIYRNNGNGTFADLRAGLTRQKEGCLSWGDYDNDGDLDVITSGFETSNAQVRLYANHGNGRFIQTGDGFAQAIGPGQWGDYDNDGDLDILLLGWDGAANYFAKVYRTENTPKNSPPSVPRNLKSAFANGVLTLSWEAASDRETPGPGLYYNLRVGTTREGKEIMAPHANNNGALMTPAFGNVQQNKSWTLRGLNPNLSYYWAVQAIDGGYSGSSWATADVISSVADQESSAPQQFSLQQNYPNPFNPTTKIGFTLAEASHVSLRIYDAAGKLIQVLLEERRGPGAYEIAWEGKDAHGNKAASGVYFYSLRAGKFQELRKMILLQ